MTVPPRGVRSRRSGRRPGWLLLSALLVLAILASSTLVFTNRVELLRLAVILSLWAAVLAAFVSVAYRRQSQLDEARARDMKFVYDLQLDREISARREYELSVEAHLRRQLGHELRAQAADEMSALRSELISLRANLEALLGTDLGDRPALESERVAEPLAMSMPPAPDRVESSRVTEVITEEVTTRVVVEEIIEDVTEEVIEEDMTEEVIEEVVQEATEVPHIAAQRYAPPPPSWGEPRVEQPYRPTHRRPEPSTMPWRPPETETRRGRHWTPDSVPPAPPAPPPPPAPPMPAPTPAAQPVGYTQVRRGRHWSETQDSSAPIEVPPGRNGDTAEPVTEAPQDQPTGGHSVADLMARLEVNGRVGGGGRRRRED
ncbi:MAG: hypothetical protein NTY24_03215 [Mycobacterium sp.]|nr:hypothetical protein [Mycobacterium sp.]